MIALADYLTREQDAATTIDRLLRILDRDTLRDRSIKQRVDVLWSAALPQSKMFAQFPCLC
jgi:hypothetical protein